MAYNVLTGSLYRVPSSSLEITGAFAGDGGGLNNLPIDTVVNPSDNRLITFTSTSGRTLNGETSLTFDGATLAIVGDVTASINISASGFYGDGSQLTGITASGGTGGGIFTQLNASQAYSTSSVLIGGTTIPSHTLSISGTLSASSNLSASAFYGDASRLFFQRSSITANYTASVGDRFLGVDTSSDAISIELDATRFSTGRILTIKDESGNANNNNVTVAAATDQTIDGEGFVTIESPYGAVNIYTNGSDSWWIY